MRRQFLMASAAIAIAAVPSARAGNPTSPCTTEPKDKWMKIEAIEAFVVKHGYTVLKSKIKNSCVELYAKDAKGERVEFFIDPATGFVVEADQKRPLTP